MFAPLGTWLVHASRAAMLTTNSNGAAAAIRAGSRGTVGAVAGVTSIRPTLAIW
jgi:hypothetical protein